MFFVQWPDRHYSPAFPLLLFGGGGVLLKLFGTDEAANVIGNVFLVVAVILAVIYLVDRSHKKT